MFAAHQNRCGKSFGLMVGMGWLDGGFLAHLCQPHADGAVAQREGIALAKKAEVYRGRKPSLTVQQADDLRMRVGAGEKKAVLARQFGISRETVYQYLHA